MGSLKTLALAGAAMLGATTIATAADLRYPHPAPLPAAPIAAPIAEASGWYLRGDIGIAHTNAKLDVLPRFASCVGGLTGPDQTCADTLNRKIDSTFFGGVGVGYQFNSWLRADITGEYRGKTAISLTDRFQASPTLTLPPPNYNILQTGVNDIRGHLQTNVFLANAYVDLGTWYGLTPFLGAGIGFANHRLDLNDRGIVTAELMPGSPARPDIQNRTDLTFGSGSGSKTTMAYALMAGVGYDVTPNYKVELGYRYLNMGTVRTRNFTCNFGGDCGFHVRARNIDAHEFRLGMRWLLGAPVALAPLPAPLPPVVKKF